MTRAALLALLLCAPTFAGSTPAFSDPVGSVVVPVAYETAAPASAGIVRDCLVVDGELLSCWKTPAVIAKINLAARQAARADPTPTACQAFVLAVARLATEHGWKTQRVVTSLKAWENHTSALVLADGRYYLLDNGAMREAGVWNAPGDWADVTALDRSGWHVGDLQ